MEWISVDHRLPEPETNVLVFYYGCIDVATYRYGKHGNCLFMMMDDSGYWWGKSGITYWMPLPEPPKN